MASSFSAEFGIIIISILVFILSYLWKDYLTDVQAYIFTNNASMGQKLIYILFITIIITIIIIYVKDTNSVRKATDTVYNDLKGIHLDDEPLAD